jgi:hypothetical protein
MARSKALPKDEWWLGIFDSIHFRLKGQPIPSLGSHADYMHIGILIPVFRSKSTIQAIKIGKYT